MGGYQGEFMRPVCKTCGGSNLGRFAWYATPDEDKQYWLCYDCNREGREPAIQVFFCETSVDVNKYRQIESDEMEASVSGECGCNCICPDCVGDWLNRVSSGCKGGCEKGCGCDVATSEEAQVEE